MANSPTLEYVHTRDPVGTCTAAPPAATLIAYNQPSNRALPCLVQGTMIHLCALLLNGSPLLGFPNQYDITVKCSQFNLTPLICLINMLY